MHATVIVSNLNGKGAQSLDVLLTLGKHVLQFIIFHVQAKVLCVLPKKFLERV